MLRFFQSTLFFVSNLKKNTIVMCVVVVCLVSFNASAAILARYSFDLDGTDDSGNGHPATIRGDASIITDAERGNVVDLPNNSSTDVYLVGTDSADNWLSDTLESGQSTIMMWAKFTDWNADAWTPALFWKGNDYQLSERNLTNTLRWTAREVSLYAPQATYSAPLNPDIADGQWHHLVGVTDAANGVLRLFVDGVEVGSAAIYMTTLYENAYPGRLGMNLGGQMDDVIFFDEALDAGPLDGSVVGTINYYRTGESNALPNPATAPIPANGATDVSVYTNLSWTAGVGGASHNVYFGTTSPGSDRGNQTETTYDPGTLAPETTYYWRIDEVNAAGTTTGTVWSFTTGTTPDVQFVVPTYFTPLRVGEVKPLGWMKAQMENDLERGFAYHLDELHHVFRADIYNDGASVSTVGAGEMQSHWLEGLLRMAYMVDNDRAWHKVTTVLDAVLDEQDTSGYIGVYPSGSRYLSDDNQNGELCGQGRINRALLAYYEITGDSDILNAVIAAVDDTMAHYNASTPFFSSVPEPMACYSAHGLMYVDFLPWLYRLTGNSVYLDYAVWLYEDFCNADFTTVGTDRGWRMDDCTVAELLDASEDFDGHGAHITDQIRIPLQVYYMTGNSTYKTAYENAYDKLKRASLPSGASIGDEDVSVWGGPTDPDPDDRRTEGCTAVFQTVSLEYMLQYTGDHEYGDWLERLMFNGIQGARTNEGDALIYCTADNQYELKAEHADRDQLSPTQQTVAVCCPPNFTRVLPTYVCNMWMRNNTGPVGLTAVAFGPSTVTTAVNGVQVTIDEITDYPFSDTIEFKVTPASPVSFTLQFRNPDWSVDTQVICPGATISQADGYYRVLKTWQNGDSVSVKFTPRIETVTAVDGTAALKRGALLYALEIPGTSSVQIQYSVRGFNDTYMEPEVDNNWWLNYDLGAATAAGDYGFTFAQIPGTDMDYPWTEPPVRLEGAMLVNSTWTPVSLVPFGSTLLRRLTFNDVTSTAPSTTVYATFDENDNFERWSVYSGITGADVDGGSLTGTTNSTQPCFDQINLSIPPEQIDKLRIRMKLSGSGTTLSNLLWKQSDDSTFANSQSFTATRDGAFHEYEIDLGSHSAWGQQSLSITALRLKVCSALNVDFEIDYILGEGRVIRDGDINEDGIVDAGDLSLFMPNWLDEAYSIEGDDQPPSPGPVVWYRFEEESGSTAYDSANNYDGTTKTAFAGSTVSGNWNANGKYGGCLEFGSHVVAIPQTVGAQISDNLTITAWIKGDAAAQPPSSEQTFFWSNVSATERLQIYLPNTNSEVDWYPGSTNKVVRWDRCVPSDWEGEWNHYAFVKDGSTDTACIYRNGILVAAGDGVDTTQTWLGLTLGGNIGGSAKYVGLIDEFKIYDRALDQSEIIGDMQQSSTTTPTEPSTPVAWYPLDETDGGPYTYDASGHGFVGTVTTKAGGELVYEMFQPNWGKLGGCLGLPGGFSEAYGLQIPASAFSGISDGFTLSLWLRGNLGTQPPNPGWDQYLLFANKVGYTMQIRCPDPSGDVVFNACGDEVKWTSSSWPDWEQYWNHYVFTKDTTNGGSMKIYHNGVEVASKTGTTVSMSGMLNMMLGIAIGGGYPYYGLIDDVRIYDYALDTGEVAWLYRQAGVAQPILQPAADLNLDGVINLSDFALFATNWLEW